MWASSFWMDKAEETPPDIIRFDLILPVRTRLSFLDGVLVQFYEWTRVR